VFAEPAPWMDGAAAAGDPIAVLPVLFRVGFVYVEDLANLESCRLGRSLNRRLGPHVPSKRVKPRPWYAGLAR
jgi:hypothetical protein